MESNTWCPLLTAAMILSGLAVHVNGFGSAFVSATKAVNGGLEIDDGAEDTTFQATSAELGEEPLDSVEPGARGWCEVENETRVAIEPGTCHSACNIAPLSRGIGVQN